MQIPFHFRIKEFDDEAVGMYVCKVVFDGREIEGYVKAEIYGIFSFKSY